MARLGLEDIHVVPWPELKGPGWVVGATPPVHRVRYWAWSLLYRVLNRASDRMCGIASAAYERVVACGPQPIFDESKLPKSASFVWSDFEPEPHRSFHVERDA